MTSTSTVSKIMIATPTNTVNAAPLDSPNTSRPALAKAPMPMSPSAIAGTE